MTRRRVPGLLVLAAALLAAGCGGAGMTRSAPVTSAPATGRPPLVISAAASLQAAFTAYGKVFTPARARFSFAGSNVLAAQIQQGLRPDVFASANTQLPDQLDGLGLVDTPVHFASNELVLATRAGDTEIRSLADVERKGVRLAIGSLGVPIGTYTRTVLARMAPAQSRAVLRNVRSEEPDVTGIVGKLTQGAVDAGFLYRTDVQATHGRLRAITLDASLLPVVTYGVAVVKGAPHPEEAKLFVYGLVAGGAGRRALLAAGFGAPLQ